MYTAIAAIVGMLIGVLVHVIVGWGLIVSLATCTIITVVVYLMARAAKGGAPTGTSFDLTDLLD